MTLLNRRSTAHHSLCLLLAALSAPGSTTLALAQDGASPAAVAQADVSYVPANASVIAVVRPAQLLKSPLAEMYPTEVMQAALVQETGLDPLSVEQIVASVVVGPPSYSVLTTFSQPSTLKEGELTKHTEHATAHNKPYLRSKELMLPSLYQPEEKSLLAAPEFLMMSLVNRDGAPEMGPLAAEFAAADKGDDLLVLINLETIRPFIMMGLSQQETPPELAPLLEIPSLLKRAELRVNLSQPQPTEFIATANDQQSAERVVQIFNDMKKLIAEKMLEESKQALASSDPVEQAGGRYSQRMMKYWDDRIQLAREGDRLILLRSDMSSSNPMQLTSIATIGILVALLLPAIQAAREAARRNVSMNNLKQIMLSLMNYESAHKAFPAGGKPLLSWRVHILPYMEEEALYKKFRLDEPWDSEHNKQLIPLMPSIFLDPSSALTAAEGKTRYLGVNGPGYFIPLGNKALRVKEISDGSSNTIAIVQVNDASAVPWTKPADWPSEDKNAMASFEHVLAGGFLAGFCDGHVRFISKDIDAKSFRAMLTAAGGEQMPARY